MRYDMVEEAESIFLTELNKAAAKGCKPIWETYRTYPGGDYESICKIIVEDPEGQTTLNTKKIRRTSR